MKIPKIKYPDKKKREITDNWVLVLIGENEPAFQGNNIIWCYSEQQVKDIIEYFLEIGEIKVIYDKEIFGKEIEKSFYMGIKSNPSVKIKVWKQIGRIRKRPEEIGGNIKQGELFK